MPRTGIDLSGLLSVLNAALVYCARQLIRAYRFFLSPYWGNQCRFEPTCSRYAEDALETHGFLRGSWLTTTRLARCHPWCEGGHDPVPPLKPDSIASFQNDH